METRPLDVLVACEESQTVCSAFRKLGHNAYSCDTQKCSGHHPEWHIYGDCIPFLDGHCYFFTQDGAFHKLDKHWDLIIAHPPCTYLTKAGSNHMYSKPGVVVPERFELMLRAREFFMTFFNVKCPYVAIENPIPMKICNLPRETQAINPYDFGHPYSKRTYLWLTNLPPLLSSALCAKHTQYLRHSDGCSRARSKTFSGIAAAMAAQWSYYIQHDLFPLGNGQQIMYCDAY